MLMIHSVHGATAPGPEQQPEPHQEFALAPTVELTVSLETKLAPTLPGAGAHTLRRVVTPPALLGPEQVVVRALIHS